ncbi:response regulator transcription factor [Thermomicrobium sp. CFH 73360]|uniref:response regulator transcription factor n=1 Tax=Thermomicrobium sp. CFH 73360 TaxID=2951987 RepID=UPI0020767AF8|nr:response regulator transcription factor [Thermomicrobium sp. CFH 73360]MCM8745150.1 response regulator transcription factor [Thermomicrobium sp. CFH 73360]
MAHILVVEDDARIAKLLELYLRRDGHTVATAADGRFALAVFEQERPDLVILDLLLPGAHGRDVCRAIRTRHATPILMLTALDDERDIVEGLDLGADDYVTKPFKPNELLARVRALLRRASGPPVRELAVGDVRIDRESREVFIGNEPVTLRPREFDLLVALASQAGRVVPRRRLLQQVWGTQFLDEDSRTLDVHVNRLRQKLERSTLRIESVRGVGYRLTLSDS